VIVQASIITFWFAMALYVGATVFYVYFFLTKNRRLSWYATFLTGAGFIMQTVSIVARWIASGQFPVEGAFNSLSLAAWGLVLVYFIVEHHIRIKILGPLLIPIAFVLMAVAQLVGARAMPAPGALLDNWRVWFHVLLIMVANAAFAVSAALSGVYLIQEQQIKRHRTNVFFRRLPSLAQADRLARLGIMGAFPVYTAGLFLGVLRAIEQAPSNPGLASWWLDPRVMLSGVILAIYGAYIFLRLRNSVTGRQAAWISIAGFVLVVITAIVARTVASGFHIFGVI
jgi:ABC-type transport system involved in cytochrome c biogenesis permease subunit